MGCNTRSFRAKFDDQKSINKASSPEVFSKASRVRLPITPVKATGIQKPMVFNLFLDSNSWAKEVRVKPRWLTFNQVHHSAVKSNQLLAKCHHPTQMRPQEK